MMAALAVLVVGQAVLVPPPRHVTLLALGDVLLARGIGRAIARHGPDYPFAPTRELVKSADLAVFNLECVLSKRGLPQSRRYHFEADPSLAKTLAANGLSVAILANNHTLDYGRDALMDTIDAVSSAGMTPVGAGADRDQAATLRIVETKGLRVGFLAYTDMPNSGVVRRDDVPTTCGVDDAALPREVRSASKRCDTLVVFFHWGSEYMVLPTERQRALARTAIDSGADLVLGCHPHVLQPTATYRGKPIAYSMGGYVFDSVRFGSNKGAMYFYVIGPHSAKLVRVIPTVMSGGRTVAEPQGAARRSKSVLP